MTIEWRSTVDFSDILIQFSKQDQARKSSLSLCCINDGGLETHHQGTNKCEQFVIGTYGHISNLEDL